MKPKDTAVAATVDKFGRIVIPKPLRDRLGLAPGDGVMVYEQRGEIRVRPEPKGDVVEEIDGVLVHTGRATGDIADAVTRARHDRDSAVAEPGKRKS